MQIRRISFAQIPIMNMYYKINFKRLTIIFLAFLLSCSTGENKTEIDWNGINDILVKVKAPNFIDNKIDVTQLGAIGNNEYDSKPAIQAAIDSLSKIGGGKVIIPKGEFFCKGSLFLKSKVNLHIDEGAILRFSTVPNDYLPVVLSRWEGIECYNYSALIYAKDEENIAITGKGLLDGNASEKNWWPWKGKTEYGFVEGMPSQLDSLNRPRLLKMNNDQIPVEERIFGDGFYLRPNFVQFIGCKNILIEGVTFKDSPMWFLHPVLSENITIKGITVVGKGPNNDGLDPESCKNVLIEDCSFDTGDDCIAIKAGRNGDGRRVNVPSENIVVRNCKMRDGHGGVVIGSEISGGCKNVFVENCIMDSPNLDRAIRIKTNSIRGGIVENLYVRDITVGEVKEAVLKINLKSEPNEIGDRSFPPTVRNIYLKNIKSKKSKYALSLIGLNESKISNINFEDSALEGVEAGNQIENVINLNVNNLFINNKLFEAE